ncbi:MAG: glycerol-3-phosphate dehydrogenase (NAD(P)+), partial [Candidatus Krumholzibacteriia bacterium]
MKAALLGTGSWATSFGRHLCHKWERVVLWGIDPDQVQTINATGTNPKYLGNIPLPPNLRASLDLTDVLQDADIVFIIVPSQAVREVIAAVAASPGLPAGVPVINLAKGFEVSTLMRLSEVIDEELNSGTNEIKHPVGVLLGPSHAEEVAQEQATAVVLSGSPDHDWDHWQSWIAGPFFRVYTNPDTAGVEIASGFKNIIALAVG